MTLTGVVEVRDRRPAGLRGNRWVVATAAWLVRAGFRPNQISLLGLGCSALSSVCLVVTAATESGWRSGLLLAAAAFIPLRGMCNLCDGLMAIEGGLKTRSGEVFNDMPDRISDPLILVAAGYSVIGFPWARELGWLAGLLAMMTAYVRVLGGCAGAPQPFCGPMAKTHRMVLMAGACVLTALESARGWTERAMPLALTVIVLGCIVTIVRRARRIVAALESR